MSGNLNNFVQTVGLASKEELEAVNSDIWQEITVAEKLNIPCQKPDIEQLTKVIVEPEIISIRLINTPSSPGLNSEGDSLTGKKLIIEGILKQKVVYVAECVQQSIHAAHFRKAFSVYLVVPADAQNKEQFKVKILVEDIFINQLSQRSVFKNITLFIVAEQLSTN